MSDTLLLPENLLLGTATAATQIEGGDRNSNWYAWSEKGRIADNESCFTAADHWNRIEEDIDLMAELNQDTYRMSLEWSRIEPEKDDWSREGIDHYRRELTLLREKGIRPLLTLHHFSMPEWLQAEGGWVNPDAVERFLLFTRRVIHSLGDLAKEYCTINEPNILLNFSYMDGTFPPGKRDDIGSFLKAAANLIIAHQEAYKLIHRLRRELGHPGRTRVGFALHMAYFEALNRNPLLHLSRAFHDYMFHTIFLKGMIAGKMPFPCRAPKLKRDTSLPETSPLGRGYYADFHGINYYSRHQIVPSSNPTTLFGRIRYTPGLPPESYNDMGWEIYPEGLFKVVAAAYAAYPLPVYITENGIPDREDSRRSRFIYDHLREVCRLHTAGIPVQRYYYWSLIDNFEWAEGYAPRFGLVHVDYATQERTIRKSGRFYAEICKERKLTPDLLARFTNSNDPRRDPGSGR